MLINHDKTKDKIRDICKALKTQAAEVDRYKTEYLKVIDDKTYTQEAKNNKLEQMRLYYIGKLSDTKQAINEYLEAIRTEETENEKILQLDVPEYTNTLSAFAALPGGFVPEETLELTLKKFAGQRQLLLTLIQPLTYEKGSDMDKLIRKYTQSIDEALYPLIEQTKNLELSPDSSHFSLYNLYKAVLEFGELHNVIFSDEDEIKEIGFIGEEEYKEGLTRFAMGL